MEKARNPFLAFFRTESASGLLLIACTATALLWANSPWKDAYRLFHTLPIGLSSGSLVLPHSPIHWINDGLMTVFFLLVGLEIKRELVAGELSRFRQALLPIAAAAGGMLVPALIYAVINRGGPGSPGWGIPMATDIAFALGALSLLGKRVPLGLKVFLSALAIMDDLGAVLVIAFFYTAEVNGAALGVAAALIAALALLGRMGVRALPPFLGLGLLLWIAMLQSGVHATLAGVLLAFFIPFRAAAAGEKEGTAMAATIVTPIAETETPITITPLHRLEHALHPYVSFLILPVFAFANAGVAVNAEALAGLAEPIGLGVGAGLVIGKPVGILLFAALAVRLRWGELPSEVRWPAMAGCSMLGGIGFTMSIFIADLSLGEAAGLDQAKLAILAASLASGAAGWAVLRWVTGSR